MRTASITASLALLGALSGSLRGDEPRAQNAARTESPQESNETARTPEDSKSPADSKIYKVWRRSQSVFSAPFSFAPSLSVPKGTELTVLATKDRWSRVAWVRDDSTREGWAVLTPPERSAGERRDELGDVMAASIALTLKGFEDYVKYLDAKKPQTVAELESYERAALEENVVREFAREGKLVLSISGGPEDGPIRNARHE